MNGSASTSHPPVTRELTVDAIRWTLDSRSPWPAAARPVLAVAIDALTGIDDELAARLVERMAITIVDLRTELVAIRTVLTTSLAHAHEQHVEIQRLRRRVAELFRSRRDAERGAA